MISESESMKSTDSILKLLLEIVVSCCLGFNVGQKTGASVNYSDTAGEI